MITQEELSRRLNKNGWMWHLVSNLTGARNAIRSRALKAIRSC